jgi:hypothetical protein
MERRQTERRKSDRRKNSIFFENGTESVEYPFLEQIDQLEGEVNLISNKLSTHEKYLKEQKELSIQHLGLFNQTLEALKNDKEDIIKLKKRSRCMALTLQIAFSIFMILFAILLFRSFSL